MVRSDTHSIESPATLVAIIVAARRAGDRELERQMKQELADQFGVKLTFLRREHVGQAAS